MRPIYECHITLDRKDAAMGQAVAHSLHWKTSEIARDPILGDATFFYLTTHAEDLRTMQRRMEQVVAALVCHDIEVLRQKIELVIFDTKAAK